MLLSPAKENIPPVSNSSHEISLTQKFNQVQKQSLTLRQKNISQFDVMGFLFKQQMKYEQDQDELFERRQKRKTENQRRFQEMILQNFKQ